MNKNQSSQMRRTRGAEKVCSKFEHDVLGRKEWRWTHSFDLPSR